MKLSSAVRSAWHSCKAHFFVVLLSALFLWSSSFAQTDAVNVSSGKYKPAGKSDDCTTCTCICIQASIDFAKLHESIPGAPPGYSASPYKSKVGFNVGVFATHPVMTLGPGNLAAHVGLEFIQKGAKYSNDPVTETIGLNYIELPIDVLFQFPIQDMGSVYAGLGPYLAYGIGGKDKYDDGNTTTSDGSFSEDGGAKRFDFGLQFIGGFKLSCMASISLYYDLGLLNVRKSEAGSSINAHDKNGVFGINLSYCLGGLLSSK